jgi:hypothetical protein
MKNKEVIKGLIKLIDDMNEMEADYTGKMRKTIRDTVGTGLDIVSGLNNRYEKTITVAEYIVVQKYISLLESTLDLLKIYNNL